MRRFYDSPLPSNVAPLFCSCIKRVAHLRRSVIQVCGPSTVTSHRCTGIRKHWTPCCCWVFFICYLLRVVHRFYQYTNTYTHTRQTITPYAGPSLRFSSCLSSLPAPCTASLYEPFVLGFFRSKNTRTGRQWALPLSFILPSLSHHHPGTHQVYVPRVKGLPWLHVHQHTTLRRMCAQVDFRHRVLCPHQHIQTAGDSIESIRNNSSHFEQLKRVYSWTLVGRETA